MHVALAVGTVYLLILLHNDWSFVVLCRPRELQNRPDPFPGWIV